MRLSHNHDSGREHSENRWRSVQNWPISVTTTCLKDRGKTAILLISFAMNIILLVTHALIKTQTNFKASINEISKTIRDYRVMKLRHLSWKEIFCLMAKEASRRRKKRILRQVNRFSTAKKRQHLYPEFDMTSGTEFLGFSGLQMSFISESVWNDLEGLSRYSLQESY